jgi:putative tryptophan/tyrosine transport system substrate-binding protein
LSAFGAKQTSDEAAAWFDPTLLTRSGHSPIDTTAVHNALVSARCGRFPALDLREGLMRRREFITLLGGAAAWPVAARAQRASKVAHIGFLGAVSEAGYARHVAALRDGLRDLGYTEGKNIIISYRWANGNYDRLPALAAELVRSGVDVIVTHGTPGTLAAKRATATVPIVAAIIGDPVASGAATSVARPGGNITGSSFFSPELSGKRVELLKELMPQLSSVAVLFNPDNPLPADAQGSEIAARSIGVAMHRFPVRHANEFQDTLDRIEKGRVQAITIPDEAIFIANTSTIAELVMKRRLPSIGNREFAQAGGLIGYGVDIVAVFRRAATFLDKILKGSKPDDIPIEQATKFQFVLNLKTAKAIGVSVPTSILLRADEVIE